MDERLKRLWAGAEADAYGDGGIAAVERATGMSRTTIRGGRDELRAGARTEDARRLRITTSATNPCAIQSAVFMQ